MAIVVASTSALPTPPPFDPSTLGAVNESLAEATPQEILKWAIENLPGLYQTTAFGLTGLAALDMVARLSKKAGSSQHLVPLVFLDTLYHFKETLELVEKVEKKYKLKAKVYKPIGAETVEEFEVKYGEKLWVSDEDTYDYLVKVEPARRAYSELGVQAAITGRRRSQGADRAALQPIEVDSTGLVKVNPLCRWSFEDVKDYVDMVGVPYNALLDQGYKSVGDWHSTVVAKAGALDERAGRWADKSAKTECGLHKDYFIMKKAFEKKRREAELAANDKARGEDAGDTSVELGLLAI